MFEWPHPHTYFRPFILITHYVLLDNIGCRGFIFSALAFHGFIFQNFFLRCYALYGLLNSFHEFIFTVVSHPKLFRFCITNYHHCVITTSCVCYRIVCSILRVVWLHHYPAFCIRSCVRISQVGIRAHFTNGASVHR